MADTRAQAAFRELCVDLLTEGVKPTVTEVFNRQDDVGFKFVYADRHRYGYWHRPEYRHLQLGTRYQGVRIEELLKARWRKVGQYWQPPPEEREET